MSVVVEFTVPTDQFAFGTALATAEEMAISLERIVPTSDSHMPFIWAEGEGFEPFERGVLADPHVEAFTPLDRLSDRVLYRIEWGDVGGIIEGIESQRGVVLEANGNPTRWYFRIRFPNHDRLGAFYDYCTDHDVRLGVERIRTLLESLDDDSEFGLTPEQREAVLLALRRGYFTTPRDVTLSDLSCELDISQQALSDRVRRATEKVLRQSLLPAVSD